MTGAARRRQPAGSPAGAAGPSLVRPPGRAARLRAWRPMLHLAARDALRHRTRSVFAVLMVALPVAGLVAATVTTQSTTPARETALRGIPDGAQAVVTATAVTDSGSPFPQLPEGAPGPWVDDTEQVPASGEQVAARLDPADRLLPYWNSPDLVATTGLDLAPGQEAKAGDGVRAGTPEERDTAATTGAVPTGSATSPATGTTPTTDAAASTPGTRPAGREDAGSLQEVDLSQVSTAQLQEAGGEALAMLVPDLTSGTLPAEASQIVVTTALAERLDIGVGDTLTLVAPPSTGWMSTDGRIGQVVQDSQRAYRVVGLVGSTDQRAWALQGWMSRMVQADGAGVDGHWLVVGRAPVTWDQARELNLLQAFAVSRHVLQNYPAAHELYPVQVPLDRLLMQAVGVLLTGVLGSLLVLFGLTPAFAVAAEQSRRTLGLAAATGAGPVDLRRMITSQGLVTGLAGGLLGAAVGTGVGVAMKTVSSPGTDLAGHFPWWVLPVGVGLAVGLGVVATLGPARTASRLQPIQALKDRPDARSRVQSGTTRGRAARIRRRAAAAGGPVLLVAAVAVAAVSLTVSAPSTPMAGAAPGTVPLSAAGSLVLVLGALGLGVAGLLICVRTATTAGARLAGRTSPGVRLALRDASDHRSRFLPAATGVLVAVAAASYLSVEIGSQVANDRDGTGEMVTGGRIVLGPSVPISADFDPLVMSDAVAALRAQLPVTGSLPVYALASGGGSSGGASPDGSSGGVSSDGSSGGVSSDGTSVGTASTDDVSAGNTSTDDASTGSTSADGVELAPLLPADRSCPVDEYPDTASAVRVGAPLRCTGWEHAYVPGLSAPWWGISNVYVMTGEALRASGLPGAEQAADVLDAGGAVVNNAAYLGTGDAGAASGGEADAAPGAWSSASGTATQATADGAGPAPSGGEAGVASAGTVRIAVGHDLLDLAPRIDREEVLPGAFVRGFAPPLTISPATARSLGVTQLEYLGVYVTTDGELDLAQIARARSLLEKHSSLVWFGTAQWSRPWGYDTMLLPVALLALLAVGITTVSLALARNQGMRDFATMHAVGAGPAFLRRFSLTQAGVVLAAGVPLGLASGIALGCYLVAWRRRIGLDGAWLATVPLWGVQAGIALAVLVAGLVTALVVARPPRDLVRRAVD